MSAFDESRGRYSSLRWRFAVGLGSILIPMLMLGFIALGSLFRAVNALDTVLDRAYAEMAPMRAIEVHFLNMRALLYQYAQGNEQDAEKEFEGLRWKLETTFEQCRQNENLSPKMPLIEAVYKDWISARGMANEIFALNPAADRPTIARFITAFSSAIDEAVWNIDLLRSQTMAEMNEERYLAQDIKFAAIFRTSLIFVLSVLAVTGGVYALAQSVLEPLDALEDGARRLGEGDLSFRVKLYTKNELQRLAVAFNQMAEKLERSQAELEELSTRDGLTHVFNYREFRRRLSEEFGRVARYNRPFSLLMLDLDRFKLVNDTFGHQAGDVALKRIAAQMVKELRPADFVARYGGEEFVIILPEIDPQRAMAVAERLRTLISQITFEPQPGLTHNVTVSIGVAGCPDDGVTDEELINASDDALYRAKRGGRDRVVLASAVNKS